MLNRLLATKLQIPRVSPALVSRPRLLEQLRAGAGCRLTLISAPAGFGKTTLAAEWAAACGWPAAWITLEASDNDLAHFCAYLIAGLRTVDEGLGHETLAAMQAQPLPPAALVLPPLLNEINALPHELLLVLDDYHLVEAPAIHAAVTFLIDHQPPRLRLLIATRADPPLPIARLRGRGQLNELRQANLSFTVDEAAALLRLSAGVELAAPDLALLADRTEGWAAGLQMAAASLRGQAPARISAFIRDFSGTHRHVLDYLVEEVLHQQSADIQNFLLRTSILARLTGPLCDAVLEAGWPDEGGAAPERPRPSPAEAVLRHLDQANLFVTALDEHREWYRYHPLFAELLRHRLGVDRPDLVPSLHARAGAWLAHNGLPIEAIPHALAAGAFDQAATLIEQAVPVAWKRGEIFAWGNWIKALPDCVLRAHPQLALFDAVSQLLNGRSLSEAEARIQALDPAILTEPLVSQAKVVRTILAMLHGDFQQSRALALEAMARLPETDLFRGLAVRALSGVALFTGDLAEVEKLLEDDARACQAAGDRLGASASLRRLGSVHYYQGRLHAAWELYQQALALSVDARGQPWPSAGRVMVHLGEIAFDWNDLATAQDYATESLTLLADAFPNWSITSYLLLARLRQAQADVAGADQALDSARQLARESETRLDDLLVSVHQARLWLRQGQLEAATRWAAERAQDADRGSHASARDLEAFVATTYLREIEQTMLARLALAAGQPGQALERLAPVLATAERQGRRGSAIEIQVLQALAWQACVEHEPARAALGRALQLAETEGYARLFLDEGEPLRRMLAQVTGPGSAYARKLLSPVEAGAPDTSNDRPRPAPSAAPLIEPLSERELEVLRLIAAGLSNQAIADKLVLSLYTVKFHTYNLYGKLGVHTRTQAVGRAQSLGLLPAP